MKSTAKPFADNSPEQKFPCLKKAKINQHVVLFVNKNSGTVVSEGSNRHLVLGKYETTWMNFDSPSVWENFEGEIILSSKD